MPQLPAIDATWSLFLDRDGVINKKLHNAYVRFPTEFEFLPGVLDALKALAKIFPRIFIVTNQQGISKGLMSEDDLNIVHQHMVSEVSQAGGRIDKIYFAHNLAKENHPNRKPGIGMALQSQKDFDGVVFKRSMMVGDSDTDILFGKRAGMKTVRITAGKRLKKPLADFEFDDLIGFSNSLTHL